MDKLDNTSARVSKAALVVSIVLLIAGLFFNRVLMSIGVIGIVLSSFNQNNWENTYYQYRMGFQGLALIIILIISSMFWSENLTEWWNRVQIKLPILLLPLAILSHSYVETKYINLIYKYIIYAFVIGCIVTMVVYITQMQEVHQFYSQGRVMWVPFQLDHQRFSWAIMGAFWLAIIAWENKWISTWVAIIILVIFTIFIHVLATRTGIAVLYITLVLSVYYLYRKNKKIAVWVAGVLIVLPIIACSVSVPLQNKIYYMWYDFNQFRSNTINAGLSDASRFIATKGSLALIKENRILGKGYGDIKQAMNDWYTQNPSIVGQAEPLMPPSQYLFYIVGCGLLGLIGFPLALYWIWTGFNPARFNLAYHSFQTSSVFLVLIETPFEVQRGAIVYGLYLALILLGIKYNK